MLAYAAMQILKQAAVIGDISYDQKGDRTNLDFVWYVWKKGP